MDQNILSVVNTYEPPPVGNDNEPIWEQVVRDYNDFTEDHIYKEEIVELMIERDQFGRKKHGVPLQAFNGRNPVNDLSQEILDAICYTKQAIEEGYDVDDNLKDVYEQLFRDVEIIYMVLEQMELNKERKEV